MPKPTGVEIGRFGGLDLRDDPEEVSILGAVDSMNVLVDRAGRLRTRDGYASFSTITTASYTPILSRGVYASGGSPVILNIMRNNSLSVVAFSVTTLAGSTGSTTDVLAATAGSNAWAVVLGTPSSSTILVTTDGDTKLMMFSVSGGSVSAPLINSSAVGGGPLAITPSDNRAVTAKGDRVNFSNAGNAVLFGTNDHVDLTPGDGEQILELVTWGNFVFAFKQTKFFVFYGTSVDGSGNPVFNYRTVAAGQGVRGAGGAVATAEGVYFANDAGVWLTTGGTPVKVSEPIDELFRQQTLPYANTALTNIISTATQMKLTAAGNQLFLYTGIGTLAYDRVAKAWTAHDFSPTFATGFDVTHTAPVPGGKEDLFFNKSGTQTLYRMANGTTTDAGSGISARYRMGFWNPGDAGTEAWIREILLDGSGSVTVKQAVNDAITLGTGQAVTLGTAPAVGRGRDRRGARARNFSYEFSGTAPWQLNRVEPIVWGQRTAGEQAA